MRIACVIATLGAGGAEATMARLAGQLAARGHDVSLITLSGPETDFHGVPEGVERVALGLMGDSAGLLAAVRANLRRLRGVRRAILDTRPDAVLSFVDATNLLVLMAMAGTGVPVVVSERIDPRHYSIGRVRAWMRPWLYRWLARRVVVQTESVAEWAREFLPPERVRVIPNAVVPEMADGAGEDLPQGFPRVDGKTVLAMGRLDPQKGFDLLIEAWGMVAGEFPDWNLVILGEGPEREALERRAAGLERVALPGKLPRPARALSRAGAFVLSSRFEGFPNALLEAMACGLPCLSMDCPSGPSDIVRDGGNGLLVRLSDGAEGLAGGLRRLLGDGDLRSRLAAAAVASLGPFRPENVMPLWERCLGGD